MPLANLAPEDREIVRRCLSAAVDGPFFPEWEFHALFGGNRSEIAEILTRWPGIDDSGEVVSMLINNTFVNLLGYPHNEDQALRALTGASCADIERVYRFWLDGGVGGIR